MRWFQNRLPYKVSTNKPLQLNGYRGPNPPSPRQVGIGGTQCYVGVVRLFGVIVVWKLDVFQKLQNLLRLLVGLS